MESEIIEVAAGLIFRNGKLLITQRHVDSYLGGLWEFPGGKREQRETFQDCLARELHEELGVGVSVGDAVEEIYHAYPDRTVNIKFFLCRLNHGEPQPRQCAAVTWVSRSELSSYGFPAADAKLLEKLRSNLELWE